MIPDPPAVPVPARRGLAALLGGSLALAGASLAVVLAPQLFGSLRGEWRNYLDMLGEANLAAWWSSALLLTAALGHALAGVAARLQRALEAPLWLVSGAVLAALSLDDHTQLHERSGHIGRLLVTYDTFPFYWLIPGLAAGIVVAAALVLLAARVAGPTRWLLVTGIVLLLACALGLELAQGFAMADGHEGIPFALIYHTEELGENLGALLLLAAAVTATSITRDGGELQLRYAPGRQVSYL